MCLNEKTRVPLQCRILTLAPSLDSNGILRARGFISKGPVSYATRHPIILSFKCYITKLMITNYHLRCHHEGNKHVRHTIQLEFTYRSPYCRRCKALPQVPIMADLPAARLIAYSPPFLCVRLDYFGPFAVKWLRKAGK